MWPLQLTLSSIISGKWGGDTYRYSLKGKTARLWARACSQIGVGGGNPPPASAHLLCTVDESVSKIILQSDGQVNAPKEITMLNGTNTTSSVVTLAEQS